MTNHHNDAPDCAGRNGEHTPGNCYDVLVSNGYAYEYETTICARSVHEARKQWAKRGDWKSEKFNVRRAKANSNPELLSACINLVGHTKWVAVEFDIHYAHLAEAEAAIARATGAV